MNHRKNKKKFKNNMVDRFYSVNPTKGDFIIMEFDKYRVTHRELWNIFDFISKSIGKKHKMIALPNYANLKTMRRDELIKVKEAIDLVLSEEE